MEHGAECGGYWRDDGDEFGYACVMMAVMAVSRGVI